MAISRTDVEKVAHLARIAITESSIAPTTERLSNVLAMVDQLQAIDTTGIEPLAHPLDTAIVAHAALRKDEVTEINQRELLLQNAPATQDGLFLVPKVIE